MELDLNTVYFWKFRILIVIKNDKLTLQKIFKNFALHIWIWHCLTFKSHYNSRIEKMDFFKTDLHNAKIIYS